MGLKTVILNAIKILLCLPLFVTAVWMLALLTSPNYVLRESTTQEELTILSIAVMGSATAMFVCTITPNIDVIHSIGKVPCLLLLFEGLLLLSLVAFPIVSLSIYPTHLALIRSSRSPLWPPLLVWSITTFSLVVWQLIMFIVFSISPKKPTTTHDQKTSRQNQMTSE